MKRISVLILICLAFVVGCDDGDSPADASGAANTANDLLKKQWVLVSTSGSHTCGIKGDGTLWCWGYNRDGQLGIGTASSDECNYYDDNRDCKDTDRPTRVGINNDWGRVSLGGGHTCALKTNGTLWCWGGNSVGQLGMEIDSRSCNDGYTCTGKKKEPTQVGEVADWADISLGGGYSCALKTNGTLWCWGYNGDGQLGIGDNINRITPVQVGTTLDWISINASVLNTCAIKTDHALWCWGSEWDGVSSSMIPVQYKNDTNWTMAQLDNGLFGVKDDGTMWESKYDDNTKVDQLVQIGIDSDWGLIDGNRYNNQNFSCAIKKSGTLWCWGKNNYGQLGIGSTENKTDPTQVGSDADWNVVSAGGSVTFALKKDGSLWCWGSNRRGELGIGMSESNCSEGETCTYKTTPTQVVEGK